MVLHEIAQLDELADVVRRLLMSPRMPISSRAEAMFRRADSQSFLVLNSQLSSITIVLSNYELPLVSYQRAT